MTLTWAALCAEALVLFAVVGTLTTLLRNRLRATAGAGIVASAVNAVTADAMTE